MFDELKAGESVLYRDVEFRRKNGSTGNGIYSARTITVAD